MAKMRIVQKSERTLRFLMGLRDPAVAAALERHGFTEPDRLRGYALLQQLTDDSLGRPPPPRSQGWLVEQLDAWENLWFPIARAVLEHQHRVVYEELFLNLRQTRGNALIVSVSTFARRFDALAARGDDATARAALEHLARRGLDAARVAEARDLLDKVSDDPDEPYDLGRDPEEVAASENELWSWYLEWSGIARATIKDRRLLRRLGFRAGRPNPSDAAHESD